VCSDGDGLEDLQGSTESLKMPDKESETLLQQGQQLCRSRGLLHGISALPKRLLGKPSGGSGSPKARSEVGLGIHWVNIGLTSEVEVSVIRLEQPCQFQALG
jgi:hypothetical protein